MDFHIITMNFPWIRYATVNTDYLLIILRFSLAYKSCCPMFPRQKISYMSYKSSARARRRYKCADLEPYAAALVNLRIFVSRLVYFKTQFSQWYKQQFHFSF